jgi:cytochrome c-type biogenesis protein CcmH
VTVAALAALLALVVPAPKTALPDVEDEVMCVTCNVPLSIAESPEADRERAFIRHQIALGKSKSEIKQALVGQYGRRVLAAPDDSGIGLAAWLVPGVLVLAGLGGLGVALPRWRRRRAAERPRPPPLPAADARRLDDELARYDAEAPR